MNWSVNQFVYFRPKSPHKLLTEKIYRPIQYNSRRNSFSKATTETNIQQQGLCFEQRSGTNLHLVLRTEESCMAYNIGLMLIIQDSLYQPSHQQPLCVLTSRIKLRRHSQQPFFGEILATCCMILPPVISWELQWVKRVDGREAGRKLAYSGWTRNEWV